MSQQYTYVSCADTAKAIRKALAQTYPDVKFRVLSKVYSGGASIRVLYTDGPATKDVEHVVKAFEGATFDGMQDLKSYQEHTVNGEVMQYGADYVFVEHKWSPEQHERILNVIYSQTGQIVTRQHHDYWRIFSEHATDYARHQYPTTIQ